MSSILPKDYDLLCAVMFEILYQGCVPGNLGKSFDSPPDDRKDDDRGGAEISPAWLAEFASQPGRRVTFIAAVRFLQKLGWDVVGEGVSQYVYMCSLRDARRLWDKAIFPVRWPNGYWQYTDLPESPPSVAPEE